MNELIAKIEQWAEDRNIIKGTKPIDQAMKLFSEFGELADNVGKGRDCRDDIGDIFVVLTIMAKQLGLDVFEAIKYDGSSRGSQKHAVCDLGLALNYFVRSENKQCLRSCLMALHAICKGELIDLQECVQIAYNDIKDRKGVVYNGLFIKESDPAYQDALDNIEADKRLATQKRISVNIEDL